MAGIDKTYGNFEQYKELRQFWLETYDEQVRIFGDAIWLYPFSEFPKNSTITKEFVTTNTQDLDYFINKTDFCFWNTSNLFDYWLMKNCPLKFIQDRLKTQYEDCWVWDYNLNFSEKISILKFEIGDNIFYGFIDIDDEIVETIDNFVVYGTSDFLKHYHNVKNICSGSHFQKNNYEIVMSFLGITLAFENNNWYLTESNGDLRKVQVPFNSSQEFFEDVTITPSYNLEDCKNLPREQVILSTDTEFYDIAQFENKKMSIKNLIFRQIPEYLSEYIK